MIYPSEKSYVDMIKPIAREVGLKYNYLPSVLAAQCIQETGYGGYADHTTESMIDNNNHLGMKEDLLNNTWAEHTVWPGKDFKKLTPEWEGGQMTRKYDYFRIYDSVKQCLEDYCLFMTWVKRDNGKYKYRNDVIGNSDPASTIKAVRINGYCTDQTYDESILKIIQKWNLTELDADFIKEEPVNKKTPIGEWSIKKSPGYNKGVPSRGNKKQYIAVHYLGVDGENNELWDNGKGAHYVVYWDGTIYQVCDHDAITWQVGTSNGAYVQKHPYARNNNTIGIEMCCHNTDGYCPGTPTGEKHWYFTEATQKATVWLVQKLMKELGLDISHVLRHYDVVNKVCPAPYVYNNRYKGTWTWDEFIAAVKGGAAPTPEPVEEKKWYRVRKSAKDEATQKGAYEVLQNAKDCANENRGYKVFDWNFKCVYDPFRWKFLDALQAVVDKGRKENWTYGNSRSVPPCADKLCSCDRSIARALYDLGFKDQMDGGETCGSLDSWLRRHGWTKVTDKSKIMPGAVVAVRYTNHSYIDHVFTVVSYNSKTGICTKYDTGSTQQIRSQQPFKDVQLLSWGPSRIFVAAWNPPETSTLEPDQKEDKSGIVYPTSYNGIDYSPVYAYSYYRKKYVDLQKAFGSDKNAYFKHFCEFGMKEGRQARATFDVQKYKARYADLRKAFGENLPQYYKHYVQFGKKEGRKAT